MVKTLSSMNDLGTPATDFTLPDASCDKRYSLTDFKSQTATVICFICNHCPYVIHINSALSQLAETYIARGIQFVAINSNDIDKYPDDAPEKMRETAIAYHYPFPYLFDESQQTAIDYNAACTPDFFIYDSEFKLVYRGQFDDSRPGNDIVSTGDSIQSALDDLLNGQAISQPQKPSLGCNIKWKAK